MLEVVFETRAFSDGEPQLHFQMELNYHYNTVCRSVVFSQQMSLLARLQDHVMYDV